MGLALYIIEDRGARRGKARHRLEEGIGKTRDMSTQPIGKAAKKGKSNPTHRDGDIAVATGKLPLTTFTDNKAPQASKGRRKYRHEKTKEIVALQER